ALLDQHGCDGDLDAGRIAPDPQCGGSAIPLLAPAVPERLHRLLLGDRHVVDSHAAAAWGLAPHLRAFPVAVRSALLGGGVPSRHVRGLHVATGPGHGVRLSRHSGTCLLLCRARRLGGRLCRDAPQADAPPFAQARLAFLAHFSVCEPQKWRPLLPETLQRGYRTTRTGMVVVVTTSAVWLPNISR